MHVQIQRNRHDVQVAGTFAIAEDRAFDPVGAGQQAQLRGRDPGAAVVMGVQTDDEGIAVSDVPANPFDLVGINVRHRDFDGVGQVQDHFPLRRRFPDLHDRFGDFLCELDFGGAEAFR